MERSPYKIKIPLVPSSLGAGTEAMQHAIASFQAIVDQIWKAGLDIGALEATASGAAGTEISLAEAVNPGDVITEDGHLADATMLEQAGRVVGVALTAGAAGDTIPVIGHGPMALTGFSRGDRLWLGTSGQIVTDVPQAGYAQRIGLAISTGVVLIMLGEPILLA